MSSLGKSESVRIFRTLQENVTLFPRSTERRVHGASSSSGYLMLIVVGREKSESIRLMPGMVAINSSSSVAEKTTPG